MRARGGGVWRFMLFLLARLLSRGTCDCWVLDSKPAIRAICSENLPPFQRVPAGLNASVADLRLNRNHIRGISHAEMDRFPNLTYLDVSRNEIADVQDGTFASLSKLSVLRLGYNRLQVISTRTFAGLLRLQELYLQGNQIEHVSPLAFTVTPLLHYLDLSFNRMRSPKREAFSKLAALDTLDLSRNPYRCACDLLPLLIWIRHFNGTLRGSARVRCASPRELRGTFLLVPRFRFPRSAYELLLGSCPRLDATEPMSASPITAVSSSSAQLSTMREPCRECPSGWDSTGAADESLESGVTVPTAVPTKDVQRPLLQLLQQTDTSAVLRVQIPKRFSKRFVLTRYSRSHYTDVRSLRLSEEVVKLSLHSDSHSPYSHYKYCIVSISHAHRVNHTCLTIFTGSKGNVHTDSTGPVKPSSGNSGTHHVVVTALGCSLALGVLLSALVCSLRHQRRKTLQREAEGCKAVLDKMGEDNGGLPGVACLPGWAIDPNTCRSEGVHGPPQDSIGGEYLELRSEARTHETEAVGTRRSDSASEISTIAKEVDRVNLIINSCIDALKAEAPALPPGESRATPGQLASLPTKGHALRVDDHLSPHAPRGYGSACTLRHVHPSTPYTRSLACHVYEPTPSAVDVEGEYGQRSACTVSPPTTPTQSSPDTGPDAAGRRRGTIRRVLDRFRPGRQVVTTSGVDEEPVAAGRALKRKVRLAKNEDILEILDYWKGVGAQERL